MRVGLVPDGQNVEDVLRCPDCISHMEIESVGDADYVTQYHSDGCPWLAAFKAKTEQAERDHPDHDRFLYWPAE